MQLREYYREVRCALRFLTSSSCGGPVADRQRLDRQCLLHIRHPTCLCFVPKIQISGNLHFPKSKNVESTDYSHFTRLWIIFCQTGGRTHTESWFMVSLYWVWFMVSLIYGVSLLSLTFLSDHSGSPRSLWKLLSPPAGMWGLAAGQLC
jgi:hypothetical protein